MRFFSFTILRMDDSNNNFYQVIFTLRISLCNITYLFNLSLWFWKTSTQFIQPVFLNVSLAENDLEP